MDKEQNDGAVEIFGDRESIITLYDEKDQPVEFYEIASIEYESKFYEILQPVELIDGFGEDEAVIFEYETKGDASEKIFKPIFDEELLNNVFTEYLRAVSDYDCDCDCDCSHGCECGHDHEEGHTCGCKHNHDEEK